MFLILLVGCLHNAIIKVLMDEFSSKKKVFIQNNFGGLKLFNGFYASFMRMILLRIDTLVL